MNQLKYILIGIVLLGSFACGSDSEEPKATYDVKVSTDFLNFIYVNSSETIHFGLFKERNDKQAKYSGLLSLDTEGKASSLLTNVEEGSYNVRVYLSVNGVVKVVLHDFGTQKIDELKSFTQSNINLISFERVQRQLFSACITCHGASSGEIASGMSLMPDVAYEQIINKTSKNSEKLRVKPGVPGESFLYQVMKRENISFDHTGSPVSLEPELNLMKNWIELGAKEN